MLNDSFSGDGFIVRQSQITDVKYGRYPSAKNGCGWIAAYNLLKLAGRNPDPRAVAKSLEKTLLFGGYLGTSLAPLAIYLAAKGLRPSLRFTWWSTEAGSKKFSSGILLCRAKKYAHYVAYSNNGGEFKFYNSEFDCKTMREFFAALKPWLCISINLKNKGCGYEKLEKKAAQPGDRKQEV